jgi:mannose/cellobiose epimerase-like protein (N-acyl-D-glucosamine 2-epimerase family)
MNEEKRMRSKMSKWAMRMAASLALTLLAGSPAWAQSPAPKSGITRAPQAIIDQHLDAPWLKSSLLDLVGHVTDNALEPNGYVQLNMDRHWKAYGVQREATVESQARQLYAFTIAYDNSHDKRYLDAMEKASNFLQKMRDRQYGGYYTRVTPDLKVLDDTKSNLQEFVIFAYASAYRVTKQQKYLDIAMDEFRVFRDKMKNGESYQDSMNRDFTKPDMSPYMKDMHHIDVPYYDEDAKPAPKPAAGAAAAPAPVFGFPSGSVNMNKDIFEAFLDLYEVSHSKEVWTEIQAQLATMDKMFDSKEGFMPSIVDKDWKALRVPGMAGPPMGVLEPAHLFQWAMVFSKAVRLGADPKYIEMGSRTVDYGIKIGYNKATGGLGGVDDKGRIVNTFWWSQCEFLKTLGVYAALHGRSDLWPYYDKELSYIKNSFVDAQFGGWYDQSVPGWSRAKLAEWSPRAYVKGSQDRNEFDAFHQTSMYKNLLLLAQPPKAAN